MIPNFHLKQQKGELTLPQTSQRKNVAGQKDLGWCKRKVEIKKSVLRANIVSPLSLRRSSLIWASEASCARTRERAPQPRGAEGPFCPLPPALASPLACLLRFTFHDIPQMESLLAGQSPLWDETVELLECFNWSNKWKSAHSTRSAHWRKNNFYQQLTRTKVREAKIPYATEEKCRNVTSSTKQWKIFSLAVQS